MSASTESIGITKFLILLALAFTLGFLLAYWLQRPQDTDDPRSPKPGAQRYKQDATGLRFYPSADFRDEQAG